MHIRVAFRKLSNGWKIRNVLIQGVEVVKWGSGAQDLFFNFTLIITSVWKVL